MPISSPPAACLRAAAARGWHNASEGVSSNKGRGAVEGAVVRVVDGAGGGRAGLPGERWQEVRDGS